MQRARDRRRREGEHVHLEPERAQQLLLRHAEALLLVEDDEAEVLRDDVAGEDRCVPMSTSTFPSAKSASTCFTSVGRRKRETISTRTGKSR